jgi:succinoglycan biosynthesis transport protein ExoP
MNSNADRIQPESRKSFTFTELISIFWRHRILGITTFILVAATVILVTFRLTPQFEASASLAIDKGHKAVEFQYDQSSDVIDFSLLNTQKEMLLAAPVLEQCLKGSDLLKGPAYSLAGEDPLKILKDRIRVTTKRDSWVITIALRDESKERAKDALQALLEGFSSSQSEQKSDKANLALRFLSSQVANARDKMEEARKREQEFQTQKAITTSDQDKNPVSQRLEILNQERGALDKELAESQALLKQLENAENSPNTEARVQSLLKIEAINRHPVVMEQQKLLYELQDKEVLLAQKYLPHHPRMMEISEQINTKKNHLADACGLAEATVKGHFQELLIQTQNLKSRSSVIEDELNQYRANVSNLQALIQETKSREDMYQTLFRRLNEEEVTSRLDAKQITLFEPPRVSDKPVNIKKPLFLAAAIFLGIVLGIIATIIAETLDRRVRGALATQEMTQLNLLGQLPFISGLAPLGNQGDADQPTVLAEAYRALRAALRLTRSVPSGCQVLVVTSSGPGEGKSTVTTRLGIALASAGSKVLLIDADLRRPSLHKQLGENTERGLSFLLAGDSDILPAPTGRPNLSLLCVGIRPPNPAELLHSQFFPSAISNWRSTYDYVIIDTPPVGPVTDALTVGELADGLILVVRDRVTTKATLQLSMDRLAPIRKKILGLIFNAEQLEGPGYGYYYRYKYKYGYSYTYANKPEGN